MLELVCSWTFEDEEVRETMVMVEHSRSFCELEGKGDERHKMEKKSKERKGLEGFTLPLFVSVK